MSAPFTSQVQDISNIITLLAEGRGNLVLSFQVFKVMELGSFGYNFCLIMLYTVYTMFTDL